MPETVALDDSPFNPDIDGDSDTTATSDGKIACPECGDFFMPGGINRHITVKHGSGQKVYTKGTGTTTTRKNSVSIAIAGAQFQQGVSLFVSMACQQCATILYQDAEKDWKAIDEFCSGRPKLRKQVMEMLAISDFMMLAGALMGTAQKMVGHHSIAKRLPFGIDYADPSTNGHSDHNSGQQMAQFMMSIPEEERNALINEALNSYAAAGANGADANQ